MGIIDTLHDGAINNVAGLHQISLNLQLPTASLNFMNFMTSNYAKTMKT